MFTNIYNLRLLKHPHTFWIAVLAMALKLGLMASLFFVPPQSSWATIITADEIIRLTNLEREKANLAPLKFNESLAQSAAAKAKDMNKYNYFTHTSPKNRPFFSWIQEADYNYTVAGENLAMDFHTPQGVMKGWMKSSKHRENVLLPEYTEIGVSVLSGQINGQPTTFVVQHLGTTDEGAVLAEKVQRKNPLAPSLPTPSPMPDTVYFVLQDLDRLLLLLLIIIIPASLWAYLHTNPTDIKEWRWVRRHWPKFSYFVR